VIVSVKLITKVFSLSRTFLVFLRTLLTLKQCLFDVVILMF